MQKLPPELVSLVHHVQLNTTGWWDTAIDRLILAAIWAHGGMLLVADLPDEIRRQFEVAVEQRAIQGSVERLRSRGALVQNAGGALKITEARLAELRVEREEADRLISAVREKFFDELRNEGIPLKGERLPQQSVPVAPIDSFDKESLWSSFETKWLQPTVCSAGARTYDLINGDYSRWVDTNGLENFLNDFPAELHPPLRNALERFLDPANADVRAFVLRLMDGYFVVEASQLTAPTISRLSAMTGQHPTFTVYLDTNFLFSLLGLHEEAAQEAALALVSLPRNLQGRVNIRLQVLPATVDETRAALQIEMRSLESLRVPSGVAKTVLRTSDVRGVAEAYLRAASKSDRPLTPELFLKPYVTGLTAVLSSHGISVANASLTDVASRPEVESDIKTQEEFENRRFGSRAKTRIKIQHDVSLWHFVNSRRTPRIDTPSDAGYWIVTEDSRLTGFDIHKRGESGSVANSLPLCLQPLALVQMLQFWLGRSDRVEEAMVGAFKLSMLSRHFDPASERATLTILEAISRWENVEDLPQEAVAHLLVNEALRVKLGRVDDDEQRAELVRNEILLEYRKAKEQLAKSAEEANALRLHVGHVQAEFVARIEAERRATEAERLRANTLEHELVQNREGTKALEKRLGDVEIREKRRAFVMQGILLPTVLLAAVIVAIGAALGRAGISFGWRISFPVLYLVTWSCIAFVARAYRTSEGVSEWWLYRFVDKARGALAALLIGVAYGILGNVATASWFTPLAQQVSAPRVSDTRSESMQPTTSVTVKPSELPSAPDSTARGTKGTAIDSVAARMR